MDCNLLRPPEGPRHGPEPCRGFAAPWCPPSHEGLDELGVTLRPAPGVAGPGDATPAGFRRQRGLETRSGGRLDSGGPACGEAEALAKPRPAKSDGESPDGAAREIGARLGAATAWRRSGAFLRDGVGHLRGRRVLVLAAVLAVGVVGGWYLMADSGVPAGGTAPAPGPSSDPPTERPDAGAAATISPTDAAAARSPARSRAPDREPTDASAPSPADRTPGTAPGPPDAERIRAVQQALARLGYDPGPADGLMGPRTRAAIRAFQAASGLAADGRLTPMLEREIRLAAAATGS